MAARRGHNEGTIFERKDEKGRVTAYTARITLPGTNGKRKSATFPTMKEARAWRVSALKDAREDKLVAGRAESVATYLASWLQSTAGQVRPRTLDGYRLNVDRLRPLIGKHPLDALKPAHIQQAYASLSGRGLSPLTVRQVHLALHKALEDALDLDLIRSNPTDRCKLPRVERKEMHWYTPEQVSLVLAATTDDRLGPLWATLATTGLRLGEALGLRWSDLDLTRKTLRVQRTLQRARDGSGYTFPEPKSTTSRRTVELTSVAVDALRAHQERQTFEQRRAGPLWQEDGLVFCTERGTPLGEALVHAHWTTACAKAAIPRYRLHDLRHTVAAHLIMAGMDSLEVAKILGHSNASLVLSVYGHVHPATRRKAADMLDALLAAHQAAR
jgi:integrase